MKKIMARVPKSSTRRLRSGTTGCRHSSRTKSKPLTDTKRNWKRKSESFAKYDQALDELKKKKKKRSDTASKVINNTANECRQRPIQSASKKALIDIGKVYRHEAQVKSKIDRLLGIDSDGDSKFDLFIPPTKSSGRSQGSSLASSPLIVMRDEQVTS